MGANPYLYNIATEAELADSLSYYDTEFIITVVDTGLNNRFSSGSIVTPIPNLASAVENNFNLMKSYYQYPELVQKIDEVRVVTYKEIIDRICGYFHLNFTIEDNIDWYSAAYFLYDFFVANFNQYFIRFMSLFIYRERASIYEAMDLSSTRKNKDSSTIYGKRLYKDIKLVTINANIDAVVRYVCSMDIRLEDIIRVVFPGPRADYLCRLVSPNTDWYKDYYATMMNAGIKSVLLTEIRFALQALSGEHDGMNKNIEEGN